METEKLLDINEVIAVTSIRKSTIYNKVKAGTFPKPRRIDNKLVRWVESELNDWIRSLPEADPMDWHCPNRQ